MEDLTISKSIFRKLVKIGKGDAVSLFLFLLSEASKDGDVRLGLRAISKCSEVGERTCKLLLETMERESLLTRNEGKLKINLHETGCSGTLEERKRSFSEKLKPFLGKYGRNTLNDFYIYWTQIGDGDKKMLFEKQKSFQIPNRLSLWTRNQKVSSKDEQILNSTNKDYTKGIW